MHPSDIGKLITTPQERDAIHVAVVPVVAGELLYPGAHVAFNGEVRGIRCVESCSSSCSVGIIDPFLTKRVDPGESCWLFLPPGSITSLRHEWTHPAFEPTAKEAVPAKVEPDPKAQSLVWIQAFADRIGQTVERVMEGAERYIESGDYEFDNSERYKDHWDEFAEFWKHFEIVTGTKVNDSEPGCFFTCSC